MTTETCKLFYIEGSPSSLEWSLHRESKPPMMVTLVSFAWVVARGEARREILLQLGKMVAVKNDNGGWRSCRHVRGVKR